MRISEDTKFFSGLDPETILRAIERLGFVCTGRVLALNSMENRVYEIEIEVPDESQVKSKYDRFKVAKFYRPGRWSKEQILEEHQFLFEAQGQYLTVIAPERFLGESLFLLKELGIYYSVFPKVGGRNLDELEDARLLQIGRLLGRLHALGAAAKLKFRPALPDVKKSLAFLVENKFIPADYVLHFENIVAAISTQYAQASGSVQTQRIHGDVHYGNILWIGEQCHLLDFDDVCSGPCVQDLWMLVPGRGQEDQRKLQVLLSGYEQFKPFNRMELGLMELLRKIRIVNFSAWIAKRWEDPAFKNVPIFEISE
ncbi:MAG: serine/threonine protein kinase [Proteobacteria bacterium]|nr:MAG: serine/threonine protein kinase [Pseudomonadota bacterium]